MTRRPRSAVVLAALALAGLAYAGGSAGAAERQQTRPSGPQALAHRGAIQLSGYSDSDGPTSALVLTGVIGDYGRGVRTVTGGGNSTQHTQLKVMVTQGSFRLDIAGVEDRLVRAFSTFPSNTRTCSGVIAESGTTPIVAGSGTGAYKGIAGQLRMTITIHEVDSYPKCTALLAESVYTTAVGTVTLG